MTFLPQILIKWTAMPLLESPGACLTLPNGHQGEKLEQDSAAR